VLGKVSARKKVEYKLYKTEKKFFYSINLNSKSKKANRLFLTGVGKLVEPILKPKENDDAHTVIQASIK
jgi:hypothetical protein